MSEVARETGRLTVFLSYSRDDLNFADQLEAALQSHKYDVAIDRHGISGGEDWRARLGGRIRDADTVIFVLSPSLPPPATQSAVIPPSTARMQPVI